LFLGVNSKNYVYYNYIYDYLAEINETNISNADNFKHTKIR